MSTIEWRGRRVLVTGHTGFKGAWLMLWLQALGAEVQGLALAPPGSPNLSGLFAGATGGDAAWFADIRDADAVRKAFERAEPEVVFHLAAQALVRAAYADPLGTYTTNVLGTAHVLDAARGPYRPRAIVVVTSDKVYDTTASAPPFDETSPLGGADPYSSSKAAAELVAASYRRSYFDERGVAIATARAGNVIGGGDWADDRLVPDLIRARQQNESLVLRCPHAVRPWQHVLDALHGYLLLAERLLEDPTSAPHAVNFGPSDSAAAWTVAELVQDLCARLGGDQGWLVGPTPDCRETQVLRLSSKLAEKTLGWRPRLELHDALDWTAAWHLAHERGDDVRALSLKQIAQFEHLRA